MRADLRRVRQQLNDLLGVGLSWHTRPPFLHGVAIRVLPWPLHGILTRGGTTHDIKSYLESELTAQFGVPATESTSAFADDLMAWYQARPT